MRADIIIPSCKPIQELKTYVEMYKQLYSSEGECNFIPTGIKASASVNRNYGLVRSRESKAEYIIMMDDDIGGFFEGWHNMLIQPLIDDKDIRIVSARLITKDSDFSPMQGVDFDLSKDLSIAKDVILSACIAFRKKDVLDKLWFDMEFIGSGFEDTLFTHQLYEMYKNTNCLFVVNNKCKLIHYHEMKNQGGKYFDYNKKIFLSRCKDKMLRKHIKEMRAYCA